MKWLFRILGALVLVAIIFLSFIYFAPAPSYSTVATPDLTVSVTPERVARGLKLVANNCQNCHRGEGTDQLTGRMFEDRAANDAFGTIYTSNITQHPTAGIGSYSDGELYRLLRTGIKRNNVLATVVMPRWPLASEEDIKDIIAFLRSDHRLVTATEDTHPPHHASLLEKALTRFAFAPTPYQENYPLNPPITDPLAYGAYQINNVNLCYYCHSQNLETINELKPKATPGYLAGGYLFQHIDNDVMTPGLLPSSNQDLASWNENEFITAVKYGIRPNKPAYQEPMHPFNLLDSSEISAMWAYLQEVDSEK